MPDACRETNPFYVSSPLLPLSAWKGRLSLRRRPWGSVPARVGLHLSLLLLIGAPLLLPVRALGAEAWRDPTAPTRTTPAPTRSVRDAGHEVPFTLTFLLVGGERRVAIVNATLVHPGARVGEATVESITRRGVRLDYKGRKIDLPAPLQATDPKKVTTADIS
ncbi:MAG: hypothetical protein HQL66_00035 [Magnetococcales bacterium]|nr:hypothetical protein [Magnetococcales bacterium]